MCKLLIYVATAPKHPTDAVVNAGMFQYGDVVSIIEDDEQWGAFDVGHHTTVVKLPGATKANFEHLLTEQADIQQELDDGQIIVVTTLLAKRIWNAKSVSALKLIPGVVAVPKGQEVAFTNKYFNKSMLTAADVKSAANSRYSLPGL